MLKIKYALQQKYFCYKKNAMVQFHQYQQNEQLLLILTHWAQTKQMTSVIGNPVPNLGHAQKCGEDILTFPLVLDLKCQYIYTQAIKKTLQRFISTLKDHADVIET
jgi:hypothetical protein